MSTVDLDENGFIPLSRLIRSHAVSRAETIALCDERERLTWRAFDDRIDRIAARLQADGLGKADTVAVAASNSVNYVATVLAVLRIGSVVAPLTASAPAHVLAAMLADCRARYLFLDQPMDQKLRETSLPEGLHRVWLDGGGDRPIQTWMAVEGMKPKEPDIAPDDRFNIIYSSGTTGVPKGIVQSHGMRMAQIRRSIANSRYDHDAVAIISTPLYSNTTYVSLLPTLAAGGRAVIMAKFDARRFAELAQAERATHSILVPVQYQRIMALEDFERFDLSSYRVKICTSAPFPAELKADVLKRWPGALIDVYGMTEGGGVCLLYADQFPDKLHTVGKPAPGHDIRLIGEDGKEMLPGQIGEVVGRSNAMMTGYFGRDEQTRQAEWYDDRGNRFIRHGDLGRFDEDGFLILVGRAKDMIISGGFNIYPSDLEAELVRNPAVLEACVVGMPSLAWGETPVAFITLRDPQADVKKVLAAANARLGRTQRISAIHVLDELPRNQVGKVMKNVLRDRLR